MILVGCDLHTRKQQVALLNTDTGELRDQELSHVGDEVERFYAALSPPVTVGIESTGYSLWFHALLGRGAPNRRTCLVLICPPRWLRAIVHLFSNRCARVAPVVRSTCGALDCRRSARDSGARTRSEERRVRSV